jgi:hypothetical protein
MIVLFLFLTGLTGDLATLSHLVFIELAFQRMETLPPIVEKHFESYFTPISFHFSLTFLASYLTFVLLKTLFSVIKSSLKNGVFQNKKL